MAAPLPDARAWSEGANSSSAEPLARRGGGADEPNAFVTNENRKWWTLGAVALGLFMIMLDNTVVNVALPTIQRDLGARLSELEWIVSGYALTFAALLLTGGKLADRSDGG